MLGCWPASEPHPLATPTMDHHNFCFFLHSLVVEGLNLQKPRRKVAGAVSQLLSQVGEWLKDSSCPVQRELDLSHVEQLLTFLTSYLGAKMSRLSERDLHHLATLLLKVP